jgi:hypothetical protein
MPVFTALAGGKVLYRPLELLYGPLQLLQRLVKYFTSRSAGINFSSNLYWQNLGKWKQTPSKQTKLNIFWLKKSSINSKFYAESVFDVNCYRKSSACPHLENGH